MTTEWMAMIGFVIIPTFITVVASIIIEKKINIAEAWIKRAVMFGSLYYGYMSFAKWIFGERENILYKCFYDVTAITYVHYYPLLLVVIIASVIVMRLLNKKGVADRLVNAYDSVFTAVIILAWIIMNRIGNSIYLVIIILSITGTIVLIRKDKLQCINLKFKEKYKYAEAVLLFAGVGVFGFWPIEMFVNNPGAFNFGFMDYSIKLISFMILAILLFGLEITYLCSDIIYEVLLYLIFGVSILGYLQANFLNGKMMQMDGSVQSWSLGVSVISIVWWCAFIVLLGIFLLKKKEICKKVIYYAAIYISLIQIATVAYSAFSNREDLEKDNWYYPTKDYIMEIGNEENVIVFILDWFDEEFAEQLYREDSSTYDSLHDFTWYQNQSSFYAFTSMSVPYLLTGIKWEKGEDDWTYRKRAYPDSDFLSTLYDNGWTIDLYTGGDYLYQGSHDIVRNYTNSKPGKCKLWDTVHFAETVSKYAMAPFGLKNVYWYQTSDIAKLMGETNQYNNEVGDQPFWNEYHKGIEVSKEVTKDFKFYHLQGAHETRGDSVRERVIMNNVMDYINSLKENGLYDSATIIITADHGQNINIVDEESKARGEVIQSSNPLLFVKMANEKHDSLVISETPVSHKEFIPTILKSIGLEYESVGKTYDEIEENNRVREFILNRQGDIPYCRFEIDGDVRNEENWRVMPD